MDSPVNQYIQDLIMDTENAARHIETKILNAFAHKNISSTQTQQTCYTKNNYI